MHICLVSINIFLQYNEHFKLQNYLHLKVMHFGFAYPHSNYAKPFSPTKNIKNELPLNLCILELSP